MTRRLRADGQRTKPGPKPQEERDEPLEGRDYYCGGCTGHRVIWCPDCVGGCMSCLGVGEIPCPACNGGAVPAPPPSWS